MFFFFGWVCWVMFKWNLSPTFSVVVQKIFLSSDRFNRKQDSGTIPFSTSTCCGSLFMIPSHFSWTGQIWSVSNPHNSLITNFQGFRTTDNTQFYGDVLGYYLLSNPRNPAMRPVQWNFYWRVASRPAFLSDEHWHPEELGRFPVFLGSCTSEEPACNMNTKTCANGYGKTKMFVIPQASWCRKLPPLRWVYEHMIKYGRFMALLYWHYSKLRLHSFAGSLQVLGHQERKYLVIGWWFGTFFIFPYIGNNHPNFNWLIFFRGVETTNQIFVFWIHDDRAGYTSHFEDGGAAIANEIEILTKWHPQWRVTSKQPSGRVWKWWGSSDLLYYIMLYTIHTQKRRLMMLG